MTKRRSLPKYVSAFCDRHGREWLRFRRSGFKGGYFTAQPPERLFWEEYDAFMAQRPPEPAPARKVVPGSIDALLAIYYRSTDYRGTAAENSLAKRRGILEAFRALHGHRRVVTARYDKLDAYIAGIAKGDGKKGGPFAAESARKQITRLFAYAVKLGWRSDNPMSFVSYRPKKTEGYHTWTEPEIERYRQHWPLGTRQRLALELMLWTGKRRSDAIGMGPQHIEGDDLAGRDKKTGKRWTIPIAPQLRTAIAAMPECNHLCFIPSNRGRAYSAASFGNEFKKWCRAAGLPHCTSHGLRKAISRRMADLEISNAGIKAITLHSRDDEVALYVAAADQKRLAKSSIARLSKWEMSNPNEGAASNQSEKAGK